MIFFLICVTLLLGEVTSQRRYRLGEYNYYFGNTSRYEERISNCTLQQGNLSVMGNGQDIQHVVKKTGLSNGFYFHLYPHLNAGRRNSTLNYTLLVFCQLNDKCANKASTPAETITGTSLICGAIGLAIGILACLTYFGIKKRCSKPKSHEKKVENKTTLQQSLANASKEDRNASNYLEPIRLQDSTGQERNHSTSPDRPVYENTRSASVAQDDEMYVQFM